MFAHSVANTYFCFGILRLGSHVLYATSFSGLFRTEHRLYAEIVTDIATRSLEHNDT
jgi:hypothetical protein